MADPAVVVAAIGAGIAGVAVLVSTLTSLRQIKLTAEIHREQMTLSQRQLFLEIWPKMEALNAIDPSKPIAPDVVRTVNVLELVAVCWEGEMVDSNVIRRSFGQRYVSLYETVQLVPNLGNPPLSGPDMLRACPAAGKLYDELRVELQNQNALNPVGGKRRS